MPPLATYDADVDAVVVELTSRPVVGTVPYPDSAHLVDVDDHGDVVAIEILTPHDLQLAAIAERFGLDDDAALTIETLIAGATTPATGMTTRGLTILHGQVRYVVVATSGGTTISAGSNVGTRDLELEPA